LHQIAHVGISLAEALSYSAVKLFSMYSNLCDHGTWTLQTYRTFWPFNVVQDHWFWHQSKARMRLLISPS